jgi:hypothetical protein
MLTLICGVSLAEEPASVPSVDSGNSAPARSAPPVSNPEYEIDYEEEVAPAEATPTPSAKRTSRRVQGGTAVQGSRAKDRFIPILKSETKSVYKKGGKRLDVDPD